MKDGRAVIVIVLTFFLLPTKGYTSTEIQFPYDELARLHHNRREQFGVNRTHIRVLELTTQINTTLLEGSVACVISPNMNENQLLVKVILASLLVHNPALGGVENNSPLTKNKILLPGNLKRILRYLCALSDSLCSQFIKKGYSDIDTHDLNGTFQLLETCTQITQTMFFALFYETIEEHYEELSFLKGNDEHTWFNNVAGYYKSGQESAQRYKPLHSGYTWINNDVGVPVAVYKPIEFFHKGKKKERNINSECLTTLLARVMNLNVLNYIIPVKVDETTNSMIYSPWEATGTLEPLLGFSDAPFRTASNLETPPSPFCQLMKHICAYHRKKYALCNPPAIYCTKINEKESYHILNQNHFKELFRNEDKPDEVNYFENDAIDPTDLYKVFVLRHLTDYRDMHTDNIIFVPNIHTGKIEAKVIDAEYTFRYEDYEVYKKIPRRIPKLYQLRQAQIPFDPAMMQPVLAAVPFEKLTRARHQLD